MKVFDGQTSDGTSLEFKNLTGTSGHMNLYVSGTLGGGTVTVEAELPDSSGWVPVDGLAISSVGMHVVDTTYFVGRLVLSGATSPNVSAWVEGENVDLKSRVMAD